ncbi:MAG: TIM barrel protein [Bacteroidales bacterium]|nr:TIM barrel protein [Bacteroidales bacterium]
MTRNEFLKSMAAASVAVTGVGAAASLSEACAQPLGKTNHNMKLGVSIYSYARHIRTNEMTIEDCVADIADLGAEYVEILAGQDVTGYPNPTDEWIDQFNSWVDKYGLKKSAYDLESYREFFHDRYIKPDEAFDLFAADIKLAKRMGFPWVRGGLTTFPEDAPSDIQNDAFELKKYLRERTALGPVAKKYLERIVRHAEENDIIICQELHAPVLLDSPHVHSIMDLIEEMKTQHLGFNLDFGCFVRRPQRAVIEGLIEQGANPEIIDYIISAYQERLGSEKTIEEVKRMGGGQIEQDYASDAGIFDNSFSDPKDVKIVAPYIIYSHTKFFDMTEDLTEYTIPYAEILQEYINNNVGIVLSSEFEGRSQEYSVPTALRMQHAMIRNILDMSHKV